MRTYEFNGRLFQGFDKDFQTPHRLVLTRDEDCFNVWAIDADDVVSSMDEFLRYLTVSESKQQIIGTYSEEGFRGFVVAAVQHVSPVSRFISE